MHLSSSSLLSKTTIRSTTSEAWTTIVSQILAICEEAALAALQAAGDVVGAETNWSPSDSMVLFAPSASTEELTTVIKVDSDVREANPSDW
jgi:hypothetical protein